MKNHFVDTLMDACSTFNIFPPEQSPEAGLQSNVEVNTKAVTVLQAWSSTGVRLRGRIKKCTYSPRKQADREKLKS